MQNKHLEIQEALTFDDVSLIPRYSEVLPQETNLETKLTRQIPMRIPLLSAAMDSVTEADTAISIAKKFSGHISVITVYKRGSEDEATKIQTKIKQLLDEEEISSSLTALLGSNPSRALVETAENEKFNLIVVGNRGLGKAAAFLLGSVSKQIVTKASCDVLVVKK